MIGSLLHKRGGGATFPTDGLVALYNMEGNALDSWGTQHGVLSVDSGQVQTSPTAEPGKLGTCLYFTPNNRMTVSGFTGITNAASINMWLKLDNHIPLSGGSSGLMDLNVADSMAHYSFSDGNIYLDTFTSVRKTIGVGIVTDRTEWHMVTVSADVPTNAWKFYQNAQLVHTSTVGTLTMKSTLTFAKSSGNAHYKGRMQVIPIYNKALSLTEIQQLYNEGNGIKL